MKKRLDSRSYDLGMKDGRTEAFIDAIRIAKRNKDRESIIKGLNKALDKCK